MSKPVDNKHTKNLDELLEHLHKPGDDLDAFEQEALEGFATLENKQEALEMKQRLDERMEEKFSKKRKPLFIYWSAAAGIALIIGLIFLTQTNKDLNSEGLADSSVLSEKQAEITENNAVAPPAELKQDEAKKMSGKARSQNAEGESMGYKNNGPVQRSSNDQQSASESSAGEVALDDIKNEPAKELEKDNKRDDKPTDALAANKGQNNEQTVPGSASGAGSDANQKFKAKEEENKDEDKSEPKATEYFSRKIKKEKSVQAKTPQSQTKSEIEGTFEKSTIQSASINIKESELTAKITKFMSDKDYKKSFVCTLTINSDNKVESIVFQNPDLFHKSEQKEITEFFKKQKCFKNHEFSVYSTYVVNYKTQ